jgi:hypothetical protein
VNLKSRAFAIEGSAEPRRQAEARHVRARADHDRPRRSRRHDSVAAVQSRYGTNRVFLVQNGQLAGKEIVLGDRLGDRVEVSQGLDAGTPIVAADVEQLADGMRVTTR